MRPRAAGERAPAAADNRDRYQRHRARSQRSAYERSALLAERKRAALAARAASAMSPQKVRRIFEQLRAANPSPQSELRYGTPFELLVAVMLSAQATDKGVNLATPELFRKAPTPQAMLKLGLAGLKRHIRTIGLYNAKARNIIATSRHPGRASMAARCRASARRSRRCPAWDARPPTWCSTLPSAKHTLAVDTHVFRVANRTGLARGATARAVEDGLLRVIPAEFLQHAHHWLILHGRYICKARVPDCPRCPIARWCEYEDKTPP